jgi:hypothetical protein
MLLYFNQLILKAGFSVKDKDNAIRLLPVFSRRR